MSNEKLTKLFILGAGASVECGFYPTGAEFIEVARQIVASKKGDREFENSPHYKYMQNLLLSNATSIDAHISYIDNENERNFLKALIISIILASTTYSFLRKDFYRSWYHEFAKLVFPTVSSDKDDRKRLEEIEENLKYLQVVTFNYDISLELYLLERARHFFKKSSDEILKQFLQKLLPKIYHVYGKVVKDENDLLCITKEIRGADDSFSSLMNIWKHHFFDKASSEVLVINNNGGTVGTAAGEIKSNQELKIPRTEFEKLKMYSYIQFRPQSFSEFRDEDYFLSFRAFLESGKISENGIKKEVQQWEVYHKKTLLELILDRALHITDKDILGQIKVIGADRNKDEALDKITIDQDWNIVYVLGYGFDRLNNERLKLKQPDQGNFLRWNRGCFVTNYGNKAKLARKIYEELSRGNGNANARHEWQIPEITAESVSESLLNHFDLFEKPLRPKWITTSARGERPFLYQNNK
jgi:hypothetical protein